MKDFDTDLNSATYSTSWSSPKTNRGYYKTVFKRAIDLFGAAILLLMLAPVLGVVWLLIRRDGGPGFYGQPRVGREGRIFTCWKLRSMCVNAEARLAEHIAADPVAAAEWQMSQKLRNDPRITSVGKFIRKYSLDELPQIWNVLCGEMSFIGPRPFMPCQEELYQGDTKDYYALRPGITGLWQVSSRNESSFADRVDYDAAYARDISFMTDLRIARDTVRVVLGGTGY